MGTAILNLSLITSTVNQITQSTALKANMAQIQVWRSKPAWRELSLGERQATMVNMLWQLRAALHYGAENEDGPFVIQWKDDWLIVWTDDSNRSVSDLGHQYPLLADYYEPMLSTFADGKRTARTLAKKLSL
jgi:hypothetical protein